MQFFIGLLLFSGVARAYCSIDAHPGPLGIAATAVHDQAAGAQGHEDGGSDECPGLPNPDKENAKPSLQWDGATDHYDSASLRAVAPVLPAASLVHRREPVAEPVFRRFPRLLI